MNDLARQVWTATGAAVAIFALFEIVKTLIFPSLSIAASHVMTVVTVGILTFFVSRYALARHNQALVEIARQAKATEEANRLMSGVLSSMREGVLIVNADMNIVLYNDAAAKIVRLPGGDAPSAGWPRLAEVTRDPLINLAFTRALRDRVTIDERVEMAGRRPGCYQLFVAPVGDDCVVGVFFDITDLERLEQVRREFFANLSHELRTPLTTVIACAETLLEGGAIDDPANRIRFIERLHKHAMRMHELISDILDLSAIESGRIKLIVSPVSLRDVVTEIVALMEARASSHSVSLSFLVPADLYVMADRPRLEQILNNLIDNAIKFNREGGSVRLAVTPNDSHAIIEVRDTGIGIPSADLPRVFERLYRGDKSRSRRVEGTGLGLAIVKHLVQAHGGEVTATSETGRGSCFAFTLPLATQPAHATA